MPDNQHRKLYSKHPQKKQVSDCLRRKQPHSMSPCGNDIQKLLLVLPIVCKHAVENFFTYISYFSVIFLVVSGILRIFAWLKVYGASGVRSCYLRNILTLKKLCVAKPWQGCKNTANRLPVKGGTFREKFI